MKNVPTDLSNLKIKVDKLGVDKFAPVPVDLSKIIYVVKMIVIKSKKLSMTQKNWWNSNIKLVLIIII